MIFALFIPFMEVILHTAMNFLTKTLEKDEPEQFQTDKKFAWENEKSDGKDILKYLLKY